MHGGVKLSGSDGGLQINVLKLPPILSQDDARAALGGGDLNKLTTFASDHNLTNLRIHPYFTCFWAFLNQLRRWLLFPFSSSASPEELST